MILQEGMKSKKLNLGQWMDKKSVNWRTCHDVVIKKTNHIRMNTSSFVCVYVNLETKKYKFCANSKIFRDAHKRHKKAPDCGISIAT